MREVHARECEQRVWGRCTVSGIFFCPCCLPLYLVLFILRLVSADEKYRRRMEEANILQIEKLFADQDFSTKEVDERCVELVFCVLAYVFVSLTVCLYVALCVYTR